MRTLLVWLGLGMLAAILIAYAWIGFLGSDDAAYVYTANQWREAPPYVPENHWNVRHTLTLTLAAAFAAFGDAEWVGSTLALVYLGALLTIVIAIVRQAAPMATAQTAVALCVVTPLTLELASIIGVDVIEAFLVLASFLAFWRASQRTGDAALLFVAGVLAGLAFINRETAVALLAWFGVVFAFGLYIPRIRHVIMAAGFFLVVGAEVAYYAVVADAPLLRFEIALGTVDAVDPTDPGTGNVTTNRWLGPISSLLINNEIGMLFWLAVPAAVLAIRRYPSNESVGALLRALSGLAVVWFVVVGYALDLRALPRYFAVSVYCANIVLAIGVCHVLWPARRKAVVVAMALFVATSLVLVDLSNRDPRPAGRILVDLVRANPSEHVWTDRSTRYRSQQLLAWAGLDGARVREDRPSEGGLYVYFPASASKRVAFGRRVDVEAYKPRPGWEVVSVHPPETTMIGQILTLVGLGPTAGILPGRVYHANPPVTVYRVPPVEPPRG